MKAVERVTGIVRTEQKWKMELQMGGEMDVDVDVEEERGGREAGRGKKRKRDEVDGSESEDEVMVLDEKEQDVEAISSSKYSYGPKGKGKAREMSFSLALKPKPPKKPSKRPHISPSPDPDFNSKPSTGPSHSNSRSYRHTSSMSPVPVPSASAPVTVYQRRPPTATPNTATARKSKSRSKPARQFSVSASVASASTYSSSPTIPLSQLQPQSRSQSYSQPRPQKPKPRRSNKPSLSHKTQPSKQNQTVEEHEGDDLFAHTPPEYLTLPLPSPDPYKICRYMIPDTVRLGEYLVMGHLVKQGIKEGRLHPHVSEVKERARARERWWARKEEELIVDERQWEGWVGDEGIVGWSTMEDEGEEGREERDEIEIESEDEEEVPLAVEMQQKRVGRQEEEEEEESDDEVEIIESPPLPSVSAQIQREQPDLQSGPVPTSPHSRTHSSSSPLSPPLSPTPAPSSQAQTQGPTNMSPAARALSYASTVTVRTPSRSTLDSSYVDSRSNLDSNSQSHSPLHQQAPGPSPSPTPSTPPQTQTQASTTTSPRQTSPREYDDRDNGPPPAVHAHHVPLTSLSLPLKQTTQTQLSSTTSNPMDLLTGFTPSPTRVRSIPAPQDHDQMQVDTPTPTPTRNHTTTTVYTTIPASTSQQTQVDPALAFRQTLESKQDAHTNVDLERDAEGERMTQFREPSGEAQEGQREFWTVGEEEPYPHQTIDPVLLGAGVSVQPDEVVEEASEGGGGGEGEYGPDVMGSYDSSYVHQHDQGHQQSYYSAAHVQDSSVYMEQDHDQYQYAYQPEAPGGFDIGTSEDDYTQPPPPPPSVPFPSPPPPQQPVFATGSSASPSVRATPQKKGHAIFHRTKTGQARLARERAERAERALSASLSVSVPMSPDEFQVQGRAGPSGLEREDGSVHEGDGGSGRVRKQKGKQKAEEMDEEWMEDDEVVIRRQRKVVKKSARFSGSGQTGRDENHEVLVPATAGGGIDQYCHQCRRKTSHAKMKCMMKHCGKFFCGNCIYTRSVLSSFSFAP